MNSPVLEKFNLKGRVAIITGGAGMLGSRYSETLLEAGARVVVADIAADAAAEAAQKLTETGGGKAMGIGVDISRREKVVGMVTTILDKWGRIDILVNNAALDPKFDAGAAEKNSYAFEEYPLEMWRQALDVNLTGAFLCSQEVGKAMVRQGGGVIVNICSTYGLVGPDQRLYRREGEDEQRLFKPVCYSVTKAALAQMTRYLAAYWGDKNIRINTLTPGGVYNSQDEPFVEKYAYRTPLGRMAEKDEMSAALLFLVSDASSYMTGANLVVDGGWTAW